MTTIKATAPTPKWVRVFHNNQLELTRNGYQHGQAVTEVDTYLERVDYPDIVLVRRVFDLLNIGDDPDVGTVNTLAVQYRDAGNRALSVGDVVGVASRFYAINPAGVQRLTERPPIRQRSSPGTVPLYWAQAGDQSQDPLSGNEIS